MKRHYHYLPPNLQTSRNDLSLIRHFNLLTLHGDPIRHHISAAYTIAIIKITKQEGINTHDGLSKAFVPCLIYGVAHSMSSKGFTSTEYYLQQSIQMVDKVCVQFVPDYLLELYCVQDICKLNFYQLSLYNVLYTRDGKINEIFVVFVFSIGLYGDRKGKGDIAKGQIRQYDVIRFLITDTQLDSCSTYRCRFSFSFKVVPIFFMK